MHAYIVSLIRTGVPVAVAAALTWLAAKTGIVLDEETSKMATLVVFALTVGGYYALARAIEERWPTLGKILVGFGAGASPTYKEPAAPPQLPLR